MQATTGSGWRTWSPGGRSRPRSWPRPLRRPSKPSIRRSMRSSKPTPIASRAWMSLPSAQGPSAACRSSSRTCSATRRVAPSSSAAACARAWWRRSTCTLPSCSASAASTSSAARPRPSTPCPAPPNPLFTATLEPLEEGDRRCRPVRMAVMSGMVPLAHGSDIGGARSASRLPGAAASASSPRAGASPRGRPSTKAASA